MERGPRHFVAAAALMAAGVRRGLWLSISPPPIPIRRLQLHRYLDIAFLYSTKSRRRPRDELYGRPPIRTSGDRRWPSTGAAELIRSVLRSMMARFFRGICSASGPLPRDGFSLYYQNGAALAAIVTLLGSP